MAKSAPLSNAQSQRVVTDVVVLARSGQAAGVLEAVGAAVGDRMLVLSPKEALTWAPSSALSVIVLAAPLDDQDVEAATHALRRGGDALLFACIDEASIGATQAMLRLGVSELFQLGYDAAPVGLTEALRRHTNSVARKAARLHVVMGLRGGVGASALAIEYAFRTVRQINGPEIALVDLDFGLGRIAERLGLHPSWRPGSGEASDEALQRHWSGLHIASAPFLEPHYPSEEVVLEQLDSLSARVDELVIDLPRGWPRLRDLVISRADVLTLVSDASATGLDVARRANLVLDTLFPDAKDVFVLINQRRLPRDRHLPDNRVAEITLGYDQVMVLDEDRDAFGRAAGMREPVHYVVPASPFVRSFSIYADAVRATRPQIAAAR